MAKKGNMHPELCGMICEIMISPTKAGDKPLEINGLEGTYQPETVDFL